MVRSARGVGASGNRLLGESHLPRRPENVVGYDAKSTLNADAGDSGSGTDLKYAGFCSVVLLCCGCGDRCFCRFHSDLPPFGIQAAAGVCALAVAATAFTVQVSLLALLSCG